MTPHRALGIAVGYIALYLLLDWVSFIHPLPAFDVTPWNPPPGVSLALLLVFGLRFLPLVLATVWSGEVLFHGAPALAPATFATALVLTVGYGVLAALLQRLESRFLIPGGVFDELFRVSDVGVFYIFDDRAGGESILSEPNTAFSEIGADLFVLDPIEPIFLE